VEIAEYNNLGFDAPNKDKELFNSLHSENRETGLEEPLKHGVN
jgi:hypothetical protein